MALVLVMFACGGAERPAAPAPATTAIEPAKTLGNDVNAGGDAWSADKGTATVKGVVKFEGDPPPRRTVDVGAEKFCVDRRKDDPLKSETFVIGEGGAMANVFVQVTAGLENWKFGDATGEVVLDQTGCQYVPHLLAAQVGQTLKVKNSDPIMHNVHGVNRKTEKDEFNWAQTKAGLEDTKDLRKAGQIAIKCDVHGWMGASLWIVKHPFFAVTGADGAFTLPKLPPGTYTIEAWHESDKLGTRTQSVTVADGETKEIVFTFAIK
jgi:plastocyanin